MTVTTLIGIIAASGVMGLCDYLLRWRQASGMFRDYREAVQAENNGELARARALYREALEEGKKRKTRDKLLMAMIERRLKTLELSTDFEESFKKKGIAL